MTDIVNDSDAFPRERSATGTDPCTGEEITLAGVIRVAVVDDHAMVAEGIARIISSEADFELIGTAKSVTDAITLIERKRPNVVIMDYQLPDGDGAEATEIILKRWPDIKVVMFSGDDGDNILSRAIEAGCAGFVAKNRPASEIVAAVRAASRGESIVRSDKLAELIERLKRGSEIQAHWLTSRELEVLRLLGKAKSTDEIATSLFLSANTVRNHVSNTLSKLGAHSKLEAVAIAIREGIIARDEIG